MVCRNPNRIAPKTRLLAFFFSPFCFHLPASVFPFPMPNFFLIPIAFLFATDQLQLLFTPLFASYCYSISCFQFLSLGIPFLTLFECINLPQLPNKIIWESLFPLELSPPQKQREAEAHSLSFKTMPWMPLLIWYFVGSLH